MTRTLKLLAGASGIAIATLAATGAQAAGTTAGSSIINNVTVAYNVGGVPQPAINASNTFVVDRRITLTVAEVGTVTTTVSPGALAQVTTFTVTNTSNEALDLGLSFVQQAGGTAAHGGTDNFDLTGVGMFNDTNGNGVYNAGTDLAVTFADEVLADTSRTIFIVGDVPIARVTGDVAGVILTAQARESGVVGTQGAIVTQTAGANTAAKDTVWADTAGVTDIARDGQFSDNDDYTVSAATLTVTKVSRIISDPFNGGTNPKMIPGATIEYCIIVANAAGGATATNVAISDTLPTQTTGVLGTIRINGTATAGVCNPDGAVGGTLTATAASGTLNNIAAGANLTLYFNATIN